MRKILWIGGKIPEGMTQLQYNSTAKILSNSIGGELVRFGENNLAIIGDERAERKYNFILSQQKQNAGA